MLEPCIVHALCESAKNLKNQPITPRQQRILRNSLRSRCLTRFIPLNSLNVLAKEFLLRITVHDINENKLWLFSAHGGKYQWINERGADGSTPSAGGRWKKVESKIHNKFGSQRNNTSEKAERFYMYDCKICLWQDHYFALEGAETLRQLIDDDKLKPMTYAANYIFSQELPKYKPDVPEYNMTMFMNPDETLNDFNYNYGKAVEEGSEQMIGYKQFLEYLNNNNLNVVSMSGIPKKFIQQSVRGGKVSIANGRQQLINEPVP